MASATLLLHSCLPLGLPHLEAVFTYPFVLDFVSRWGLVCLLLLLPIKAVRATGSCADLGVRVFLAV